MGGRGRAAGMGESGFEPGQRSLLENVPRLFEQAARAGRRGVQFAGAGWRGEQANLCHAGYHGGQPLGDAAPRAHGAAALPRSQLVREDGGVEMMNDCKEWAADADLSLNAGQATTVVI